MAFSRPALDEEMSRDAKCKYFESTDLFDEEDVAYLERWRRQGGKICNQLGEPAGCGGLRGIRHMCWQSGARSAPQIKVARALGWQAAGGGRFCNTHSLPRLL